MKKAFRLFAALMAIVLIACSLAGCGGKEKTKATTDGKSFTYWTVMDNTAAATLSNYSEMMMYQELEKRTGVHIDFIHPIQGSTGNEAFITMLSSEKMPDMIEYTWTGYTGGAQGAVDDGVIVALNDYLEDHAPNYYDYMEGEKGKANDYLWKLQSTTDDGSYFGFNVLNIGTTKGFAGIYARADKLREWNMEVPETIDEWTAVLAKAKAEGFQKPFSCMINVLSFKHKDNHCFNTAYDVGKGFYLEDDKVVFAPFQPGYKEYMAQMHEWSKKGYIDTGFVTNDWGKLEGNMANDISFAAWGFVGSAIGKILPAAQAKNPNFDLVACPYPVAKKGDTARFQVMYPEASFVAIGISGECGNVEKAVEWCDYFYSEEGSELQIFGIEGDTYTVEEVDGVKKYTYTDKILKHEGFESVGSAMWTYMLPCNHPGLNQHPDYLNGYYPYEAQKEAIITWNEGSELAKENNLPTLSYTEEELAEITDIEEVAKARLEVAFCDIILGEKSMDTYDAAIEQAKKDGYERVIEIRQAAYDRYLSKK